MATLFPRDRFEIVAMCVLVFLCLVTWESLTAWGILAASIGAEVGRLPEDALSTTRTRATMFLALIFACQIAMLVLAAYLAGRRRRRTSDERNLGRMSNWFAGVCVVLGTDAVVLGVLLAKQIAVAGRLGL